MKDPNDPTSVELPLVGIGYPVPSTATTLTHEQMADYFRAGLLVATGREAKWEGTPARLVVPKNLGSATMFAYSMGIIGGENADGHAFVQHNWGNISADPTSYRGPFWISPTVDPNQPIAFRAYDSHTDGAAAWWRLMMERYRPVLWAAANGDAARMAAELYRLHYVVGAPGQAAYGRSIQQFANAYLREKLFANWAISDAMPIAGAGLGMLGIALAGALRG